MPRARLERGHRVRDAETDVIVRVDADGARQACPDGARDVGDLLRNRSAVRVAEHDDIGAAPLGRLPRRQGVLRIVLVTVERVFGVVDNEAAAALEIPDRVFDHRDVFVGRRLQHFFHVQQPRLANDSDDWRLGVDEQPHLVVGFRRHALAARRAKRREPRVLERPALRFVEKLDVFRIAAWPAALDVMHAEGVQPFGNAQLVENGERDAEALAAVPEGRVVDLYAVIHGV